MKVIVQEMPDKSPNYLRKNSTLETTISSAMSLRFEVIPLTY